jgi:hypothetical protein
MIAQLAGIAILALLVIGIVKVIASLLKKK